MPRGFPITETQRHAVLRELSAGRSYAEAAARSEIPRGTVGTIGRAAISAGKLAPRPPGAGRAPRLSRAT